MKNRIITITITIFLATALFSPAQEVVSSAGKTSSVSGYAVSWTLGEPVIQTWSSGNTKVTQGFHQSRLTVTPASIIANDLEIKVYPNPAGQFVNIHYSKLPDKSRYTLYNLAGERLNEGEIRETITRVNLQNQASGSYLLKLTDGKSNAIQSFKIVKK